MKKVFLKVLLGWVIYEGIKLLSPLFGAILGTILPMFIDREATSLQDIVNLVNYSSTDLAYFVSLIAFFSDYFLVLPKNEAAKNQVGLIIL